MIKQGIALKSAVCQRCIVHRAPVVSQRVRTTQYDMKYLYPHFQVKKQDMFTLVAALTLMVKPSFQSYPLPYLVEPDVLHQFS